MATELAGTIAGAFCGVDDIADVSRQLYTAGSKPNLGTVSRMAAHTGNDLVLWLEAEGFAGAPYQPATVDGTSVIGKALRRINGLAAARELIRNIPERERPEQVPEPESLTTEITSRKEDLLTNLKVTAAGVSKSGLSTHWKTGDTAELSDDKAGEEEAVIRDDFVTMDTKF